MFVDSWLSDTSRKVGALVSCLPQDWQYGNTNQDMPIIYINCGNCEVAVNVLFMLIFLMFLFVAMDDA